MTVTEGIVEHGDARGRTIGFPTANLSLFGSGIEDGVWAAQVRMRGDRTNAIQPELYLAATDLDTCERIVFGANDWDDVPISTAVRASTAFCRW